MNQFKDFGIQPAGKILTGDKISIERILNREIVVHEFQIKPSKFEKGNGKCLHLQISIGDTKYVVFTGAYNLMEMISRIPEDHFPFKTTIIKENKRLQFT